MPTLLADGALADCLRSLEQQTVRDFEVVVVDNSGRGLVRARHTALGPAAILENARNLGFGAAINAAHARSGAPFLATLNDDAVADPRWLEALLAAAEARPEVGMCASRVRLASGGLDSAGMLLCGDGSSRQRGHRARHDSFCDLEEVLLPSACAALYRRRMLEEIGGFDEDFFLYCEDTDLGLRARWAGWKCLYVPEARVLHRYSHSSGRASPQKAYYAERNRLFVAIRNFPARMLWAAPFVSLVRYAWHAALLLRAEGAAADYRREGRPALELIGLVGRAHWAAVRAWPHLWRARREIRASARISPQEFRRLALAHAITPRQVAAL